MGAGDSARAAPPNLRAWSRPSAPAAQHSWPRRAPTLTFEFLRVGQGVQNSRKKGIFRSLLLLAGMLGTGQDAWAIFGCFARQPVAPFALNNRHT